MQDPRVALVREHVEALRLLDRGLRAFGAASHRWRTGPPLGAEQIASVEDDLGFRLPASYRAYLLDGGNGGAGPLHGLRPLPVPLPAEELADLRRPFPGMVRVRERVAEAGIEVDPGGYHEIWDAALRAELLVGTRRVADDGCGHHARIVLHGAEPGTVVHVANEGGIYGRGVDFLDWVESSLLDERRPYERVRERMLRREHPAEPVTTSDERIAASLCGIDRRHRVVDGVDRDEAFRRFREFAAARGG